MIIIAIIIMLVQCILCFILGYLFRTRELIKLIYKINQETKEVMSYHNHEAIDERHKITRQLLDLCRLPFER